MVDDDETREGASDPESFVRDVLGESPYDKQVDILNAVARARRVSVVGCNGSGKDWAAARAVLWWLHSRSPAKAIVTGPTTRQVDDIVWNELRAAYAQASDRLGGRMFRTSRYELDEQTFALGFATSSPYNLQGFHSPNLMVVLTEAHAVREADVDAVRRLHPRPPAHDRQSPRGRGLLLRLSPLEAGDVRHSADRRGATPQTSPSTTSSYRA